MKTFRNSYPTTGVPAQAEFYYYSTDNLLRVENHSGGVTVYATRDNLSAHEKSGFIRQLAMEGFIPDRFQAFSDGDWASGGEVRWEIDDSWTLRLQPIRLVSRFGRPCVATGGLFLLLAVIVMFFFRITESTVTTFTPRGALAESVAANHRSNHPQD